MLKMNGNRRKRGSRSSRRLLKGRFELQRIFSDGNYDRITGKNDTSVHQLSRRYDEEERSLLLEPEAPVEMIVSQDRILGRQESSQRLSSESSFPGSLFSGTTVDGNVSSEATKESQLSSRQEDEETMVISSIQRSRERYYLQLTLAIRLSSQASLDEEPPVSLRQSGLETGGVSCDIERVSYRLWVSLY